MRKNLLERKAADEMIARARRLRPESQGRWGRMNVTEMLQHCNTANRLLLEGGMAKEPSSLKQRIIKFLFLNFASGFPHNAKTPPSIARLKTETSPDQFADEQRKFIENINRFVGTPFPPGQSHPVFGRLTNREWGIITWMHMDHHLRQFGV